MRWYECLPSSLFFNVASALEESGFEYTFGFNNFYPHIISPRSGNEYVFIYYASDYWFVERVKTPFRSKDSENAVKRETALIRWAITRCLPDTRLAPHLKQRLEELRKL